MIITGASTAIPFHLDNLNAAFSLGHTLAISTGEKNFHFFKKLAKNESLLFALKTLSMLGTSVFVAIKAQQIQVLFRTVADFPQVLYFHTMLGPGLLTLSGIGIIDLCKVIDPSSIEKSKNEHYIRNDNGYSAQLEHGIRVVIQLAAVCFAPTNPFIIFSAACAIYDFYKVSQEKWIVLKPPEQEGLIGTFKTDHPRYFVSQIRSFFIKHHLDSNTKFTVSLSQPEIPAQERFLRQLKSNSTLITTNTAIPLAATYLRWTTNIDRNLGSSAHLMMWCGCVVATFVLWLLENSKGQAERELQSILDIRSSRLNFDNLNCAELRNNAASNTTWEDPITFENLSEDQILSPATLIIDKMAFSMRSVILQLFCHPKDSNDSLAPPNSEEFCLYHPIYRRQLNPAEQDSVTDQICRTFMISASDFRSCWNLDPAKVPGIQAKDLVNFIQSTAEIQEENRETIRSNLGRFTNLVQELAPYELYKFIKSERATYFQLMRFHNFCQLLPEDIRKKLQENLPAESVEKLRIIQRLA